MAITPIPPGFAEYLNEQRESTDVLIREGKKMTGTLQVILRTIGHLLTFRRPKLNQLYIEKARESRRSENAEAFGTLHFQDARISQLRDAALQHEVGQGSGRLDADAIKYGIHFNNIALLKELPWLKGRNCDHLRRKLDAERRLTNLRELHEGIGISSSEMELFLGKVIGNRSLDKFSVEDLANVKQLMNMRYQYPLIGTKDLLMIWEKNIPEIPLVGSQERDQFMRFVALYDRSKGRTHPEKFLPEFLKFVEAYKGENRETVTIAFNRWIYSDPIKPFNEVKEMLSSVKINKAVEKMFGNEGIERMIEQGAFPDEEWLMLLTGTEKIPREARADIFLHQTKHLLSAIYTEKDVDQITWRALIEVAKFFPKTVEVLCESKIEALTNQDILDLSKLLMRLPPAAHEGRGDDASIAAAVKAAGSGMVAVVEAISLKGSAPSAENPVIRDYFIRRSILSPQEVDEEIGKASGEELRPFLHRVENNLFIYRRFPLEMHALVRRYLEREYPDVSSGKRGIETTPLYTQSLPDYIDALKATLREEMNREFPLFTTALFERAFKDVKTTEQFVKQSKLLLELRELLTERLRAGDDKQLVSAASMLFNALLNEEIIEKLGRGDTKAIIRGLLIELSTQMKKGYQSETVVGALKTAYQEARKRSTNPLLALERVTGIFQEGPNPRLLRSYLDLKIELELAKGGLVADRERFIAILMDELKGTAAEPNANVFRFADRLAALTASHLAAGEGANDFRKWAKEALNGVEVGKVRAGIVPSSFEGLKLLPLGELTPSPDSFRFQKLAETLTNDPARLITELLPLFAKEASPEDLALIEQAEGVLREKRGEVNLLLERLGVKKMLSLPPDVVSEKSTPLDIFFNLIDQKGGASIILGNLREKVGIAVNQEPYAHPLVDSAPEIEALANGFVAATAAAHRGEVSPFFNQFLPWFYGNSGERVRSWIVTGSNTALSWTHKSIFQFVLRFVPLNIPFDEQLKQEDVNEILIALITIGGVLWKKEQAAGHVDPLNRLLRRVLESQGLTPDAFQEEQKALKIAFLEFLHQLLKDGEEGDKATSALFKGLIQLGKGSTI